MNQKPLTCTTHTAHMALCATTSKERDAFAVAVRNWPLSTVCCLSCRGADISREHGAAFALEHIPFFRGRTVILDAFYATGCPVSQLLALNYGAIFSTGRDQNITSNEPKIVIIESRLCDGCEEM